MSKRIIMKEGVVYRPSKPFPYSTLYKLVNFCEENGLRLGQALSIAIANSDSFYIEDAEMEKKIQSLLNGSQPTAEIYDKSRRQG